MWFEPDDCSRVANNVVSFAINGPNYAKVPNPP